MKVKIIASKPPEGCSEIDPKYIGQIVTVEEDGDGFLNVIEELPNGIPYFSGLILFEGEYEIVED